MPPTITFDGIFFCTTELGAIITLSPIKIFPTILTPGPIHTLLPIVGTPSGVEPTTSPGYNLQLSPNLACALITILC